MLHNGSLIFFLVLTLISLVSCCSLCKGQQFNRRPVGTSGRIGWDTTKNPDVWPAKNSRNCAYISHRVLVSFFQNRNLTECKNKQDQFYSPCCVEDRPRNFAPPPPAIPRGNQPSCDICKLKGQDYEPSKGTFLTIRGMANNAPQDCVSLHHKGLAGHIPGASCYPAQIFVRNDDACKCVPRTRPLPPIIPRPRPNPVPVPKPNPTPGPSRPNPVPVPKPNPTPGPRARVSCKEIKSEDLEEQENVNDLDDCLDTCEEEEFDYAAFKNGRCFCTDKVESSSTCNGSGSYRTYEL